MPALQLTKLSSDIPEHTLGSLKLSGRFWERKGKGKVNFTIPDEHHIVAVTLLVMPSV